jgi:DNA ligase D-like protein (predicted 3'-phosphoesterase)
LQLKKATKVRKEEDYGMEAVANRRAFRESAYAMKKHLATRLHYDLRLEWNRVLLSWALPEGPDCRAGITREAIEMDDHRLAYLQFEGVHETGPSCFGIVERGNHIPGMRTSEKVYAKEFSNLSCTETSWKAVGSSEGHTLLEMRGPSGCFVSRPMNLPKVTLTVAF